MPFDREETLRRAEKLLRQGKLDAAIAEYRAVVDDQPSDWNTANTLGDLYFRAGQVDKAVAEYNKIAEHLGGEGFIPKAVALYKKILKIKPDEERAMWHLGNIAARQGLLVDARANLTMLAERRRARGDARGEAEVRVRLGDLDGADLETRLAGARARVELGDAKTAVERLKHAAAALQEKGRDADALRLLTEAAQIDPDDLSLRGLLVDAYAARCDFDAACQFATSARQLQDVARQLFEQGREDEGLNVLASAADADPADADIRTELAKRLIGRGDIAGARRLLTPEVAGNDHDLLWAVAEIELREGRVAEGTALLERIVAENPGRRDDMVLFGCAIAETNVDAGFECVEVAARAAAASGDWAAAAAALNEFANRVPQHIPALMRLVEVCVDGGLEAAMFSAQAQLADAYLAAGAGLEARVIAEDLVAREPWDRANVERFRRALTLLGQSDIDQIIADRLSGQSPFTTTGLWSDDGDSEMASPSPGGDAAAIPEVDLSEVIDDLQTTPSAAPPPPPPPVPPPPLERVLQNLRDEAAHDSSPETAEQHIRLAATYVEMDMKEEAIGALKVAARSIRHRFRAGALLGKFYRESGDLPAAIDWYGRAVEAPAPSPAALHALLYDLASLLEANGEGARALAVLLELQASAGEYRDVAVRLEQLKVQMDSAC